MLPAKKAAEWILPWLPSRAPPNANDDLLLKRASADVPLVKLQMHARQLDHELRGLSASSLPVCMTPSSIVFRLRLNPAILPR
jgi:hypothetical protein